MRQPPRPRLVSRAEAVRVEEAHANREKGESPLTRADYRLFRYWTRSLLLLVKWVSPSPPQWRRIAPVLLTGPLGIVFGGTGATAVIS